MLNRDDKRRILAGLLSGEIDRAQLDRELGAGFCFFAFIPAGRRPDDPVTVHSPFGRMRMTYGEYEAWENEHPGPSKDGISGFEILFPLAETDE